MEPFSARLEAILPAEVPATIHLVPAAAAAPTLSTAYRGTKRAFDIVGSLLAILLTLPIWLAVAVAVRATSRGPVLFRQPRVGKGGRSFTVLKFRSMCRDAEDRLNDPELWQTYVASGHKLPADADCRVTRVGRFLRRSSLDELPQLLNVLRGDMSLVGPRPVTPAQVDCYGELVHCYLGVRPGITGMWQVNGRSRVEFPERAHLDLYYFEARSFWLDLTILARTPLAVLRCEGAY